MTSMRILVVEDEPKIANALKKGLELESFAVDVAYTGSDGFGMIATHAYDLAVLDRMLPDIEGIEVAQAIRDKNIHVPIIFLTAKDAVGDRVAGLNAGADDYLVKPFAFDELVARVRALLRRPKTAIGPVLRVGDIELDTHNHSITRRAKTVRLTAKEFALLEYFMRNSNRVVTKEQIIENVWDFDADILPNTVEVYVRYLRQKLEKPFGNTKVFETVRGVGYRMRSEHV